MGAVVEFAGGLLGGASSAKRWNDRTTNWGDTQSYYDEGIRNIQNNAKQSVLNQEDFLSRALNQQPEFYMQQYEPVREQMVRNANRQLAARGLSGSGQAVSNLNDLNNNFNNQVFSQALNRINSNNAMYMNAANQNSNSMGNAGSSLANLYSNLGNLRYENSPGKHMLSLWGGN